MLRHLSNFLLYSNIWIALAALAMSAKTTWSIGQNEGVWQAMYGFVFCCTLFIYAGHRVLGLYKTRPFQGQGRYRVINRFKWHIWGYAILGGVGGLHFFLQLSLRSQWLMLVPGLLSLAYILPVIPQKGRKRLRDVDGVKIFLVALVWPIVVVIFPYVQLEVFDYKKMIFNYLEVFTFVFAITLPFDIRDLEMDQHNQVETLPAKWGLTQTKNIAQGLLLSSFAFFLLGTSPSWATLLAMALGYAATALLIHQVHPQRPDYYYTGLLDGTLILIPVLYAIGTHAFP